MTPTPAVMIRGAEAFGLDVGSLRRLGGSSSLSWGVGEQVLRVGPRPRVDVELAASAAAAAVVPVPRVLDRAELGDDSAVLLERLPGHPAAHLVQQGPDPARAAGRACGAVHAKLAAVAAPAALPAVSDEHCGDIPAAGSRVLHLDLHPFNILVNDDGDVTGVLDWANAASGDPVLDRARSWSILTLDPNAVSLATDPCWAALTEGWAEAGELQEVPSAARAWACRFMLKDLAVRYLPHELQHVADVLRDAESAVNRRVDAD